eukprot:6469357-Amphidinium_carterae.2
MTKGRDARFFQQEVPDGCTREVSYLTGYMPTLLGPSLNVGRRRLESQCGASVVSPGSAGVPEGDHHHIPRAGDFPSLHLNLSLKESCPPPSILMQKDNLSHCCEQSALLVPFQGFWSRTWR